MAIFEVYGNIYNGNAARSISLPEPVANIAQVSTRKEIQLRDYQHDAYKACLDDLLVRGYRSSLVVLATGLGKTILFSKIIQSWSGRILVLVRLETLLQNAYEEIESITGEILGIERASERHLGERIVVATVQSISNRLTSFDPTHFTLIIYDEAHHSAAEQDKRVLSYFTSAKVIGLTATDVRADGKALPFETCSYRMGIREGIESGYLVPIRGKRIIIDSVNLSRVKQTKDGDFDDEALDDEMVKGASAIADVILSDYAFSKGILFFPGCASAKLTSELLNKRCSGISVYIDGKIIGTERKKLISRLRSGETSWLCNVGIATEGFNWPEAAVIGMCCPTTSRAAYVQRAGRGTRPLEGLLNGLESASLRISAIDRSHKPHMTLLDFVGVSANLNLISAESFLEDSQQSEPKEKVERVKKKQEEGEAEQSESEEKVTSGVGVGFSRIISGVQSTTLHQSEDFDPFEASGEQHSKVKLKTTNLPTDQLSEKQYNLLKRWGIDDSGLNRKQAQTIVGFIASVGFRISAADKAIARKLYKDVKQSSGHI